VPDAKLPSGWPAHRGGRWLTVGVAGLLAGMVAVALVHKPSQAERASDMRGLLQEVNSDIESCAAGVRESLQALRIVQAEHESNRQNVTDAISVADQGAANCQPANNEQIDDLESYQVPESLDGYGLPAAVTDLVQWAVPDAAQVQDDVAAVLSATSPAQVSTDEAALARAISALNAKRAAVYGPMDHAIESLAMKSAPPRLPG
jgi:hypothetical protein